VAPSPDQDVRMHCSAAVKSVPTSSAARGVALGTSPCGAMSASHTTESKASAANVLGRFLYVTTVAQRARGGLLLPAGGAAVGAQHTITLVHLLCSCSDMPPAVHASGTANGCNNLAAGCTS
jgi:hypothetical protein